MVKTYKSKKVILLFIVLMSLGCASLQAQTKRTTRTKTRAKQKTYTKKTQAKPVEQKVIVIHDTVIQQQPVKKDTTAAKELVVNDKIKEQPVSNIKYSPSKSNWFLEFNPIFYTGSNSPKPAFTIAGGFMGSVSKYVALGFGIGLTESFEFKGNPSIPIFGRMEFEDKSKELSPFITLDMGYGINLDDFSYGSIIINPTIGARFNNVYIGGGYTAFISTNSEGGTTNCINLKLGYKFGNNNNSAFLRFLKQKTYLDMEIGAGIGTNSYKIAYGGGGNSNYYDKIKIKDDFFINLTWNYRIDDNIIVGLGSGLHVDIEKVDTYHGDYNGSYFEYDYTDNYYPVNGSIYARFKYLFLNNNIKLTPFICFDIGPYLSYSDDGSFAYNCAFMEPQVGIKFKNVNLSLGYLYMKSKYKDYYGRYDNDTDKKENISFLNLRLGFRL